MPGKPNEPIRSVNRNSADCMPHTAVEKKRRQWKAQQMTTANSPTEISKTFHLYEKSSIY
jgi:hypothetical protein